MPRLSVWMIRAALVQLGLGFTAGALMLANKAAPLHPALWNLLPLHIELLLTGWTLQLALGAAYWILPRFRGQRPRSGAAWLAFFLLNAGVLAVIVGQSIPGFGWLALAGRALEAAAVAAFAVHAWPRIKPPGAG